MTNHRMRKELDQVLAGIRLEEAAQEAIRARVRGLGRRERGISMRAAVVLALCALLAVTALAAGSAIWEAVTAHLGARAPYASRVLAESTDQGLTLRAVAALADENLVRVYLTLTDLEGDRLGDAFESDLGGYVRNDTGGIQGDLVELPLSAREEVLAYDGETKTLTLCETFYGRKSLEPIPISMRRFTPGYRTASLTLDSEANGGGLAAVPALVLSSATDEEGRTVLLPDQNPIPMEGDWGAAVSSIGFAADGRLHIRLDAPGYGAGGDNLTAWVWHHQFAGREEDRGHAMTCVETPVEGGVDLSFAAEDVSLADLADIQHISIRGSHSVLGGEVRGTWDLTVPLEPVERRALTWTGGPIRDEIWRDDLYVDEVWLSPLGISVNYHNEGSGILEKETPLTVTLRDGTRLEPAFVNLNWVNGRGGTMWTFDEPIDLEQVAEVTLARQSIDVG